MENYSITYDFKIFVIRGLIHLRIINSDVAYNYLIILSLYTYHKLIILIQSLLFSSQTTPICNLYIQFSPQMAIQLCNDELFALSDPSLHAK